MKPFIKWAGGKRWLAQQGDFSFPVFNGRYIEPFFGGGAVFFHLQPSQAIVSDTNHRLIEMYCAIKDQPSSVKEKLKHYQKKHSSNFYYEERARQRRSPAARAAQFIYLNRTCWNGLYRENLKGVFNVPIGTKSKIFDIEEDFTSISEVLKKAEIVCRDFEATLEFAKEGDFVFIDPPYTTAHNLNGFVKYNQNIFSWDDQIRLRNAAYEARKRGAAVCITNAMHKSIYDLYEGAAQVSVLDRRSVISGQATGRRGTAELLIQL